MSMPRKSTAMSLPGLLLIVLGAAPAVAATPGITDTEIVLGQSCALSGPAQELGKAMQTGLLACFDQVNSEGGIAGRRIRLVSKDDGYEPDRAIDNTRELIDEDRVFLLIGEVGTPTSAAVVPLAEQARVPFFGPFTGAEFLRHPFRKYVINVRGSYYQEMEHLAAYLVDGLGLERIACFYQNDGYGQAGLAGIEQALARREMALRARGTYERNTTAVKGGLLRIRKDEPQAVVMVGAYKPCAEFIRLARRILSPDVVYCNISFVGTEALRDELGDAGEGCIVSQVVNHPRDAQVPLVAEFNTAMERFHPDAHRGFVALEGFMVGQLFCRVLAGIEGEITREKFIETVERVGVFDLGGVVLNYGPTDHQGMDRVFLTVITKQAVVPLDDPLP